MVQGSIQPSGRQSIMRRIFSKLSNSQIVSSKNRSFTATRIFSNSSTTQRNNFLRLLSTRTDARQAATVEGTKTKQISAWQHWNSFINNHGLQTKSTFKDSVPSAKTSLSAVLTKQSENVISLEEIK